MVETVKRATVNSLPIWRILVKWLVTILLALLMVG